MSIKHFGMIPPLDPSEMISRYFSLGDLTQTNTGLDNTPNEAEYKNVRWLASTLDDLYDSVGPFNVISAFRSSAVQQALKESGAPTGTGKKSFHEAGMAADLYPTTMSLDEFFGKILASDWVHALGEISIKPSQNAIHISLPTTTTVGKVMTLNELGQYVRLTADEIADYAKPYLEAIVAVAEEAGEAAIEAAKKPATRIAIVGLFALVAGWFFLRSPKTAR